MTAKAKLSWNYWIDLIKHPMFDLLKTQIPIHIGIFLCLSNFLFQLSYIYPLVLFMICDFLTLMVLGSKLYKFTKNQRLSDEFVEDEDENLPQRFISFLEQILNLFFKIFICVYISFPHYLQFCYSIVILIIFQIIKFIIVCCSNVYEETDIAKEKIEISFKLFFDLQILMIIMKINGRISWQWKDIFWVYWVLLTIMVGISFGFFVIFVGKVYQKCVSQIKSYRIIGIFWVLYIICGLTINSVLFVRSLIIFYAENPKNQNPKEIWFSFIYISVYICVLSFLSIYFQKDLRLFLENMDSDESDSGEEENQTETYEAQYQKQEKKQQAKMVKKFKDHTEHIFPYFVNKFSSTYFKAVNNSFVRKSIFAPKKCAKKKQVPKAPLKSASFMIAEPEITKFRLENNLIDNQNQDLVYKKLNSAKLSIPEQLFSFRGEQYKTPIQQNLEKKPFISSFSRMLRRSNSLPLMDQVVQKQNEETKSNKLETTVQSCLVCFENTTNAVFMNCGHGGVCYECAIEIMEKTGECYLCRGKIKQVLRIDLDNFSSKENILNVLESARMVTQNDLNQQQK